MRGFNIDSYDKMALKLRNNSLRYDRSIITNFDINEN